MTFAWEKGIELFGDTYSTCGNIDLDIFVSDAAGFDINDPWATVNWTNYAATGDCPEEFTWNMADWGDGEFIIWHDLWYNGFAGYGTNVFVPVTATFFRPGAWTQDIVQNESQAANSDDWGVVDDYNDYTGAWHNGVIAKIIIADGKYTITDYDGTVFVDNKSLSARTERPSFIQKDSSERGLK